MVSGFRFWISFPWFKKLPDKRQALPAQTRKANEHEPPTIAKQTKARIQPKPNKQTVRRRVQKASKLQNGKNKSLIALLYTELNTIYCTEGDNVWPRGHDIAYQHNFTILSLCQRLNTEEAKTRLYIPPKISTFPSNQLYLKTFQLLFFIHSVERSIGNLLFDQCCNQFYYLVVDASEPEILLWTVKSIESPPLGVNTKKKYS